MSDIDDKSNNSWTDPKIQDLILAIDALREAQVSDQKEIKDAIKVSERLHKTIESLAIYLSKNVPEIITNAAHDSAKVIADTALQRLENVNQEAKKSEAHIQAVIKALRLKLFAFNAGVLLLCFGLIWITLFFYFPTKEELEARQTEVISLERAIDNLERQGARAIISTCNLSNGKALPCIRTDEHTQKGAWGDNQETYRLLWQGKK